MAVSPNRVAANRSNARHSTEPKTPEGKARASLNARKHPFDPSPFAIVRIEDRAAISTLVAEAIATYHPINSQERDAVERIALEQHRAYWLAFGFNSFNRQSNIAATFLRFQAHAERLHRRAVEDFHRLLKLRDQLPPEKYEDPIEPKIEPIPAPQPAENTVIPVAGPPIPQPSGAEWYSAAEWHSASGLCHKPAHNTEPRPALDPALEEIAGRPPAHHPGPIVVPKIGVTKIGVTKIVGTKIVSTKKVPNDRQAAKSRAPP